MSNKHIQVGSSYDSQFGSVEEDFPPHTGRPRKPVRPVGHIALSQENAEFPAVEPGEHSVFEVAVGPSERSVFEVRSVGGVALASIVPANTRPL